MEARGTLNQIIFGHYSGVYFLRLKAESKTLTGKMLLLK